MTYEYDPDDNRRLRDGGPLVKPAMAPKPSASEVVGPRVEGRATSECRWRAISRVWGKRSSSSRPASNKCLAMLPSVPSRTGGPGYQRRRRGWLPRSRAVHMIKLTETREITPYLWMHPDDER
jgi:hypothetical protein